MQSEGTVLQGDQARDLLGLPVHKHTLPSIAATDVRDGDTLVNSLYFHVLISVTAFS